jgi:hypothetical protein
MEPVPHLALQAHYHSLRSEVLTAARKFPSREDLLRDQPTRHLKAKFAAYCANEQLTNTTLRRNAPDFWLDT